MQADLTRSRRKHRPLSTLRSSACWQAFLRIRRPHWQMAGWEHNLTGVSTRFKCTEEPWRPIMTPSALPRPRDAPVLTAVASRAVPQVRGTAGTFNHVSSMGPSRPSGRLVAGTGSEARPRRSAQVAEAPRVLDFAPG
jgi:hypothetical protein